MNIFTIISNFLVTAAVFFISCPDESKGYVIFASSCPLGKVQLRDGRCSINRFNPFLFIDHIRKKTTKMSETYPGIYNDQSGRHYPTKTEPNQPILRDIQNDISNIQNDKSNIQNDKSNIQSVKSNIQNDITTTTDSEDYLKVIPLDKKPVRHETSANFKRSNNDPYELTLKSRL